MPSRFDTQLASDFVRAYSDFKETVIRRAGGRSDKTENVEAVVDRDHEAVSRLATQNGLVVDQTGERLEKPIALEIAATQEHSTFDTWVVEGQVFQQIGENVSEDGGSQTIICSRRKSYRDKEPRTINRR